jgi:hypothetical protein
VRRAGDRKHYWRGRLVRWLTPRSLTALRRRRVKNRLLHGQDQDEDIVDEVFHHPVVYTRALAEALLAALVAASAVRAVGDGVGLLLLVALAILVHAAYLWLLQFLDIFVITNVRMLRVSGILNIKQASTPVSRILDITLKQPLLGRFLDYGHFVFESAAQEQGLRDIRFVPQPLVLNEKIQSLQMDLLTGRRSANSDLAELADEEVAPVDLDP